MTSELVQAVGAMTEIRRVGVQANCFADVLQRQLVLLEFKIGVTPLRPGALVSRVELNRLRQILDGQFELPLSRISMAGKVPSIAALTPGPKPKHAASVIIASRLGSAPNGPINGGDRLVILSLGSSPIAS